MSLSNLLEMQKDNNARLENVISDLEVMVNGLFGNNAPERAGLTAVDTPVDCFESDVNRTTRRTDELINKLYSLRQRLHEGIHGESPSTVGIAMATRG